MINGIINVYKEAGYTSHDVVARLRGITHQKKIGHTGTLDPDAVGVLPVCLGAATHVCDMLTDETKEYRAELLLGITTDTQDISGKVLAEKEVTVDEARVREVISHYIGDLKQIPPMYSALKVNGQKLYELARAGKEVERKPRDITVFEIEIEKVELPKVTMRVTCSKGTYIRTLCNDIGDELGCGATMSSLARTRVGRFEIEEAIVLDKLEEITKAGELDSVLLRPQELFDGLSLFTVNERGDRMATNGNVLTLADSQSELKLSDGERVRVMREDGFFFGVYRYSEDSGLLKPVKMFLC